MKLKRYAFLASTAAVVLTLAACSDEDKKNKSFEQMELEGAEEALKTKEIENTKVEDVAVSDELKEKIKAVEGRAVEHFEGYEWLMTPKEVNVLMVQKANAGLLKENIKTEHLNTDGDKILRHTYKDTILLGMSDLDITYEFHNNIRFEAKVEDTLLAQVVVTLYNTTLEEVAAKMTEKVGEPLINDGTYIAYNTDTTEMIGKLDDNGNVMLTYKLKESVYAGLK